VYDRFRNPFIKHQLASIALNSISKFKVRVLPSLLEYVKRTNSLPMRTVYAFACLIRFYKGSWNEKKLPINDDMEIVSEIAEIWKSNAIEEVAGKVLNKTDYWDTNLTEVEGLEQAVTKALLSIEENGIKEGFSKFN